MDQYDDASLDRALPNSSQRFVHVEAWTIPLSIQYMPEGADDWIDNFRSTTGWAPNVSGYLAVFHDTGQHLQIPLYSLCQTYEKGADIQREYAPDLIQDSLLGIVLGRCEDVTDLQPGEGIFVLVVQSKGQHFERVGHMEFKHAMLKLTPRIDSRGSNETPWQLCFRSKERRTVRLG